MRQRLLVAVTTIIAMSFCLPPAAADEPWSGFHLAATAGYLESDSDISIPLVPTVLEADSSSSAWGLLAGYSLRRGRWAFGIEGDWSSVDASHDASIDPAVDRSALDSISHIRLRGGRVWNRTLVFAAVGLAFVDYQGTAGWEGAIVTRSKTLDGTSLGVGVEYAFGTRWRLRGEYLSDDFGTTTIGGMAEIFDRFHTVETKTLRAVIVWEL